MLIGFFAGLITGGVFGIIIMALLNASNKEDKK